MQNTNLKPRKSANINFTGHHLDVKPLIEELAATNEWNKYVGRLNHPQSPHRDTDDIWLRYAQENLTKPDEKVTGPHESVWYPSCEVLPSAKVLAQTLFDMVGGKQFGGCLIIRVPPGKQVYTHVDRAWHATHYEKIVVQIAGNRETEFSFEDGGLSPIEGEVYWADNYWPHWLINHSAEPWINLTVNYRR